MLKVLEYSAIFFNVVYLILAIRVSIWCWFFGIIGVILSFLVYIDGSVRLYSDASLQIVYLGLSIYGWVTWNNDDNTGNSINIRHMQLPDHLKVIGIGLLSTYFLGLFWSYFGASLPFLDAATTSFAIITTVLVVQKFIENWIYWIIIDVICAVLYFYKGIEGFALLFIFYAIMSLWGYKAWKSKVPSI